MATLKQILDSVMGESGFLIPAAYANSPSPDDMQLVHLANAASDDIREAGLVGARRFASIVLDGSGSYTLPTDFHAYVPDTAWVGFRKVDLPTTPQDWAVIRATGTGSPEHRARLIAAIKLIGDSVGETLSFEYVSAFPWQNASAVPIEIASSDSDTWLLDRRLLTLGIKWRWKKEKGVEDWAADQQLYQRHLSMLRGRDGGAKTLYFGDAVVYGPAPSTPLWVT